MADPMAMLLDVTRTVSRFGQGPLTGIDRVERAYIKAFGGAPGMRFLMRRQGQQVLLGSQARHTLLAPPPGPLQRTHGFIRLLKHVQWRGPAEAVAPKTPVLSVGHTNLASTLLRDRKSVVMVHDMIPLDHPNFTRPAPLARFEARMRAVSGHAAHVICPSHYSASRAAHWFDLWGNRPQMHVIPLGLPEPSLSQRSIEPDLFVAVGTVEPRKGYDLLLDIWAHGPPAGARLHVFGRKGWAEEHLVARLRSTDGVTWSQGASDQTVAETQSRARALVFPSQVEGVGLPVGEALARGVPVLASDLPPLRELFGDGPGYLPFGDLSSWRAAIEQSVHCPAEAPKKPPRHDWETHFSAVNALLSDSNR